MKRGEIWWVDFDPSQGGEIQKTRPAIIISNDYSNARLNRVQVIPLTSNVKKCYASECYIHVQDKPAKAMTDQVRTVDKKRLKRFISQVTAKELLDVEGILAFQLGMKAKT